MCSNISRVLRFGKAFEPASATLLASDICFSEFERIYLRRLVDRSGGNLARAARVANVDRTTLYRLLEKHNIGVRWEGAGEPGEVRRA